MPFTPQNWTNNGGFPLSGPNLINLEARVTDYTDQLGQSVIYKSIVNAKGDLLVGTANDIVSRLGIGTDGQVLKVNSATQTGLEWGNSVASETLGANIIDAKGDLIAGTANDTPARLGVGSNGSVLTADSSTQTGLKWSVVSGTGGTIPGVNVKDYGAVGDGVTDDSAAVISAVAALPSGGGKLIFPAGTYLLSPLSGTNAAINYNGHIFIEGEGKGNTNLKSGAVAAGTSYTLINAKGGYVEVADLTLTGPTTLTGDRDASAIKLIDAANTFLLVRNVEFKRWSYSVRANNSYINKPEITIVGCFFDGESIGLSSGHNADRATGILASGDYPLLVRDSIFKNLGSNTTQGTNTHHAISMYQSTPAMIVNSRFLSHVDGMYIRWAGTMSVGTNNYSIVKNCYFGSYQTSSNARGMHSMVGGHTIIEGCDFNMGNSLVDIDFKGEGKVSNCVFRGDGVAGGGNHIEIDETEANSQQFQISGCTFRGNRDIAVKIASTAPVVNINNCLFNNDLIDHIRIDGQTSDVSVNTSIFKMTSNDVGIKLNSGIHTRLRVADCEFGDGKNGIETILGSQLSKLNVRDNVFQALTGSSVVKSGTVTVESANGNIGYKDVDPNDKGVIVHETNASTTRPSYYTSVEWIGSVQPANATSNDTWVDTSA